jgi:hypothetical protein
MDHPQLLWKFVLPLWREPPTPYSFKIDSPMISGNKVCITKESIPAA